jgi:hypothetical protein
VALIKSATRNQWLPFIELIQNLLHYNMKLTDAQVEELRINKRLLTRLIRAQQQTKQQTILANNPAVLIKLITILKPLLESDESLEIQ